VPLLLSIYGEHQVGMTSSSIWLVELKIMEMKPQNAYGAHIYECALLLSYGERWG
jgi:hypothetical protein